MPRCKYGNGARSDLKYRKKFLVRWFTTGSDGVQIGVAPMRPSALVSLGLPPRSLRSWSRWNGARRSRLTHSRKVMTLVTPADPGAITAQKTGIARQRIARIARRREISTGERVRLMRRWPASRGAIPDCRRRTKPPISAASNVIGLRTHKSC